MPGWIFNSLGAGLVIAQSRETKYRSAHKGFCGLDATAEEGNGGIFCKRSRPILRSTIERSGSGTPNNPELLPSSPHRPTSRLSSRRVKGALNIPSAPG
ncbi:hypothetical protein FRC09_002956 [Ceratobasidium sp. 395]|nr:hypothetical protein FRC09_002956 [Ceratobasidium sp. 395]